MNQPTDEQPPPAYLAHRGMLVALLVLVVLLSLYLMGAEILAAVQWVLSKIQAVRQAWSDL
jgi:hypothetical protein